MIAIYKIASPSNTARKVTNVAKSINMKRTTLNAKLSGQSKNNTNIEYKSLKIK